jgi:hypothetical protein
MDRKKLILKFSHAFKHLTSKTRPQDNPEEKPEGGPAADPNLFARYTDKLPSKCH